MIQKNWKSDFKIREKRKDGKPLTDAPFRFTYYVKKSRWVFVAEFDGEKFTNCYIDEEGWLRIAFDNHEFGKGALLVTREYFLSDNDFNDGICHLVSDEYMGVMLDEGKDQNASVINIEIPPYYQKGDKGDKGDPLRYEDLTVEQKRELMSNVPSYAGDEIIDITTIL